VGRAPARAPHAASGTVLRRSGTHVCGACAAPVRPMQWRGCGGGAAQGTSRLPSSTWPHPTASRTSRGRTCGTRRGGAARPAARWGRPGTASGGGEQRGRATDVGMGGCRRGCRVASVGGLLAQTAPRGAHPLTIQQHSSASASQCAVIVLRSAEACAGIGHGWDLRASATNCAACGGRRPAQGCRGPAADRPAANEPAADRRPTSVGVRGGQGASAAGLGWLGTGRGEWAYRADAARLCRGRRGLRFMRPTLPGPRA
jgi:hypothetical protein